MVSEMVEHENTCEGTVTYLKACSWMASSFHNVWLANTPQPEDMKRLLVR